MKKSLGLALAASGLFLGLLTSNANASFVADGDFTAPSGGGSFVTYGVGAMGPWNVTSGTVDLIGGYWQAPSFGGGSVDMDGNSPGSISQALSLGAGNYILHFSLSGNPDNGPSTKFLQVSVGNALQNFNYTTGANTHSNMNYLNESLAFNTTGATNLTFSSLSTGGFYGAVIGKVSVSAVPLPAALPMFVLGLLGLFGFHSFNRKNKLSCA